ncbi:unnamed protein product, partial [Urochloa humidicola]
KIRPHPTAPAAHGDAAADAHPAGASRPPLQIQMWIPELRHYAPIVPKLGHGPAGLSIVGMGVPWDLNAHQNFLIWG